jgi:uncharacterized protein YdiU (UPF0061 family)
MLHRAARRCISGAGPFRGHQGGATTETRHADRLLSVRRCALRSSRDDFGKLWIGVRLNGRHYRLTPRYSAPSKHPEIPALLRNAGFAVTRETEHDVSAIKTREWAARGGQRASRPGRPMSGSGNPAEIREAGEFNPCNLERDDDAQEDDENAIENDGRINNDGCGVETGVCDLAAGVPAPDLAGMRFDNSYARLPARFFARLPPTPVAAPRLVKLNTALAAELGLDAGWLASAEGVAVLAGNAVPAGAEPIAQAYAGHQFGGFSPQLGDGRAILLGELIGRDGQRRDLQLKGSGPTPFSRNGDGRAALGPVLREYIISEAMHAFGIPTTRSLAAVTTGETVRRETELPGAVLTRVAASHVRVGTFQYFAARQDVEALRLLADHVIARHHPQAAAAPNPYRGLLEAVIAAQAELVARWMLVGFIHGVMNTDNMTISGETIDYGPCAFMDGFDPAQVYSSIDYGGRYAFGNQPRIALWNLTRLAEALLPLLDEDQDRAVAIAKEALGGFGPRFDAAWEGGLARKIGLTPREGDTALVDDLLRRMAAQKADWTLTFRGLADGTARAQFGDPAAFDEWDAAWRARLAEEGATPSDRAAAMRAVNPAFIPRNHQVERALAAAMGGDLAPFETLLAVLARPFEDQPEAADYALPPKEEERVLATFCGT